MVTNKVAHGEVGININHEGKLVLLQAVSQSDEEFCRICLTPKEANELIDKLKEAIKKVEVNAKKSTDSL
jgi:hypothetical protein